MRVVPVPLLSDNYGYLLIDSAGYTAAIDPVEPAKVLAAAEKAGVKVSTILTTHHHWRASVAPLLSAVLPGRSLLTHVCISRDHAGGNEEFAQRQPGVYELSCLLQCTALPGSVTSKSSCAGITVVGGVNDNVAGCTQTVQDGETIQVGKITVRCIETPL